MRDFNRLSRMSCDDLNANSKAFSSPTRGNNYVGFLPGRYTSGSLGQVQGRILRDLDGLIHGGQQTLTSLSSQGGAETLRASDQKLHHHVCIFLNTLPWYITQGNGQVLFDPDLQKTQVVFWKSRSLPPCSVNFNTIQ